MPKDARYYYIMGGIIIFLIIRFSGYIENHQTAMDYFLIGMSNGFIFIAALFTLIILTEKLRGKYGHGRKRD